MSQTPQMTPTSKPTLLVTGTPNVTYNPTALSQNDLYPAGIAAAVVIGITLVAAIAIKKRQIPTPPDASEDVEFI